MGFPGFVFNQQHQLECAQDWFWYIKHCWYPNGMPEPIELSDSVVIVMDMLEDAWFQGEKDRACFEIERIREDLIEMNPVEKSVASTLCAHVLISMKDRQATEETISDALIWMPASNKHHKAVLTWLLGVIHWVRPGMHNNAINEWKDAIGDFFEISIDPSLKYISKQWYDRELELMRRALRRAIEIDQLPCSEGYFKCPNLQPRPDFFSPGRRYAADENPPEDEPEIEMERMLEEEIEEEVSLQSEPQSGLEAESPVDLPPEFKPPPIPAGLRPEPSPAPEGQEEDQEVDKESTEEFQAIRELPLPSLEDEDEGGMIPIDEDILAPGTSPLRAVVEEFLEYTKVRSKIVGSQPELLEDEDIDMPEIVIPIFRIEDRDYNVHYLGKNRHIRLPEKDIYFFLVKGNSMNVANIADGDIVAIRYQEAADNGDIVAAIIGDPTKSEGTLKRYRSGQKIGAENSKKRVITLEAESTESEYQDWKREFSPALENQEEGFFIRGVAVAVLKPIKI